MARRREARSSTVADKTGKPISDMAPEDPGLAAYSGVRAPGHTSPDNVRPHRSPTEDEIRARAYQRYEKRGRAEGRADEDWYVAEREIRQKKEEPGAI